MSAEVSGIATSQNAVANSQAAATQAQTARVQQAQKPKVEAPDPAEMARSVEDAVAKLNELMRNEDRSLNFSVDRSTDQVVVRVLDTNTKEVIRQIPNEEALKLAEYIEGLVGIIFERKV